MSADDLEARSARGDEAPVDVIGDRIRAWWSTVLAGQLGQSHPTWGSDVKFKLVGDELEVRGELSSEEDLQELTRELDAAKGTGISDYTLDVSVKDAETAVQGMLEQTLVGVYETAEQARFAVQFVESSFHISPTRMTVIEPVKLSDPRTRNVVPDEYWEDVEKALKRGRAVLILTVDEIKAFKTREALDEETRSLTTFILPPQPVGATAPGIDPAVAARAGQTPRPLID
jgi:hypothetical protein